MQAAEAGRVGLNLIPVTPKRIETPTGCAFAGSAFEGKICGVSIMRAGESMEHALRECCRYAAARDQS